MSPAVREFLARYPFPERSPEEFCRDFDQLERSDRDECLLYLIQRAARLGQEWRTAEDDVAEQPDPPIAPTRAFNS